MRSLALTLAAWLVVHPLLLAQATNYQRMTNVRLEDINAGVGLVLKSKRDDAGCRETYGGGSVVCGGQDSEFCYDPSIGESCCPLDNSYCDAGEFCAPLPGYCCKNGEDLLACVIRQGVPIPASLPPIPASLLPPAASMPPSIPSVPAGLPMAGTEFPLPTIVSGTEVVGTPLLQSATEPVASSSASLLDASGIVTAIDILPSSSSAVSSPSSTALLGEQSPCPTTTATITIPIGTKAPASSVIPTSVAPGSTQEVNSTIISPPVITYTGAAPSLQLSTTIAVMGMFAAGWAMAQLY
ncbi:hypothetical protein PVAG01_04000 [Phlyctema vagabunda]|uniref:Uncharacterized protein n=1 Tax=Phlyctema vagabunda TaxID=108571 RepID=A0ABR4PN18_9HELO